MEPWQLEGLATTGGAWLGAAEDLEARADEESGTESESDELEAPDSPTGRVLLRAHSAT